MKVQLIEETRRYEFKWWSGTVEPYDACFRYDISEAPSELQGGTIFVAVGWRAAYGANRRRILVFRNRQKVLVEFVGADDWEESHLVVWPVKLPGSHRGARSEADIPGEFRQFTLGRCPDWITGPSARRTFGVCAREDDHETLIRVALIRERHKRQKVPRLDDPVALSESPEADQEDPQPSAAEPLPRRISPRLIEAVVSYSREYGEQALFPAISRIVRRMVTTRQEARRNQRHASQDQADSPLIDAHPHVIALKSHLPVGARQEREADGPISSRKATKLAFINLR